MLTGVHDHVGHLWRHLGDHHGPNALGELFHCDLGIKKKKRISDRSVSGTAACATQKAFLTPHLLTGA